MYREGVLAIASCPFPDVVGFGTGVGNVVMANLLAILQSQTHTKANDNANTI